MAMRRVLTAIQNAFHRTDCTSYRVVEGTVWGLILASVGLFGVDLLLGPEHSWASVLEVADWVVLGLFGLEIGLRILSYEPPSLRFYRHSRLGRLRVPLLGRFF